MYIVCYNTGNYDDPCGHEIVNTLKDAEQFIVKKIDNNHYKNNIYTKEMLSDEFQVFEMGRVYKIEPVSVINSVKITA